MLHSSTLGSLALLIHIGLILIATAALGDGAVHQLTVRHHPLPSAEALATLGGGDVLSRKLMQQRHSLERRRQSRLRGENAATAAVAAVSQSVDASEYALVGSASIGTPRISH